jgi:hypothetical protein
MLYPPDIMHLIFFSKSLSIHKFESIITNKTKYCQNMLYIVLFSSYIVFVPGNSPH